MKNKPITVKGQLIKGDDNDLEALCDHGVGHSNNVHTCDGTACHRDAIKYLKGVTNVKKHKRT